MDGKINRDFISSPVSAGSRSAGTTKRRARTIATTTEIAIVGAGPYGLSIAAYLRALGREFRIIGRPMETWLTQMPKGMSLESEGFASNLYDPDDQYTLERYCAEQGIRYAHLGLPVTLETFCAYGLDFQKRCASSLEHKMLAKLERSSGGFTLTLDDGEIFTARRVVLALGISYFRHLPAEFADLPAEAVTHSSKHHDLKKFCGRNVAVVGGGSSAIDLAALLHEAGAHAQLVARRPELEIRKAMKLPRALADRIRAPLSGLGPSWRSRFYTDAPLLFHFLPEEKRLQIVKRHFGPTAGWFMRDRLIGKVPLILGHQPTAAEISNGRVQLHVVSQDGTPRRLEADHVVCATGYRVDLRKIACLSDALRTQIDAVEHTPILSAHFESSIPGLYFIGPAAANSFGPLMRFAFGARYAAGRVTRHLARHRNLARRRNKRVEPSLLPMQPSETAAGAGD